jgi:hypothetical protein
MTVRTPPSRAPTTMAVVVSTSVTVAIRRRDVTPLIYA